jgi:hypothetical protein
MNKYNIFFCSYLINLSTIISTLSRIKYLFTGVSNNFFCSRIVLSSMMAITIGDSASMMSGLVMITVNSEYKIAY